MSINRLFRITSSLCLIAIITIGSFTIVHAANPANAPVVKKNSTKKLPKRITMSKDELMNKIKGGWAGQTIGVT